MFKCIIAIMINITIISVVVIGSINSQQRRQNQGSGQKGMRSPKSRYIKIKQMNNTSI